MVRPGVFLGTIRVQRRKLRGSFREMRTSRWGRTSSPTTVTSTALGPRGGSAYGTSSAALVPDLTKYPVLNGDSKLRVPNKAGRGNTCYSARWKCPSNANITAIPGALHHPV